MLSITNILIAWSRAYWAIFPGSAMFELLLLLYLPSWSHNLWPVAVSALFLVLASEKAAGKPNILDSFWADYGRVGRVIMYKNNLVLYYCTAKKLSIRFVSHAISRRYCLRRPLKIHEISRIRTLYYRKATILVAFVFVFWLIRCTFRKVDALQCSIEEERLLILLYALHCRSS